MSITHWPEQERPREKLLTFGKEHLSDAELLAILLGHGTKGQSAVDIARHLLTQFGSLHNIFSADYKTLSSITGVGEAKYTVLQASTELQKRYLGEALKRHGKINSSQKATSFLIAELKAQMVETFSCLFLDAQHQLIRFEILFKGTLTFSPIFPREIIKRSLFHNAAKLIIAHNHPSGHIKPSRADKKMTKTLKNMLLMIEVELIDHIIVGDNKAFSMNDNGLI